jgi:hypothetical protein
VVLGVLVAVVLTACARQTNPATTVGTTTATMTGAAGCLSKADTAWAWQWRELGTSGWSTSTAVSWSCARSGPFFPIQAKLAGLKPDTSYQYRLLLGLDTRCDMHAPDTCIGSVPVDSRGTAFGSSYDTFTTQPVCDDVQGANEPLSSFVRDNPAGTQADRRVLCLRQGTQNVGQLNGIQPWTTLTPSGDSDGTKQPVVLNGNVSLDSRGAAIEDVKIVGCYYQAGCDTQRNKAVDVRADDVTISHVEVSQRGGRNADSIQCVLVSADRQLSGLELEYSKAHSCGSESAGNHQHGLYCEDAINPRIVGNWFYDNEGFGIQMWPNCDGAQAVGNVVSDNGAACEISGESPSEMSTGVQYRNGFCGNAREQTLFPPIHCNVTAGNKAIDMVTYGRYRDSHTDCEGPDITFSGLLETDPKFVDRGDYDLRMRSSAARAKLGIYAEIVPGPRW